MKDYFFGGGGKEELSGEGGTHGGEKVFHWEQKTVSMMVAQRFAKTENEKKKRPGKEGPNANPIPMGKKKKKKVRSRGGIDCQQTPLKVHPQGREQNPSKPLDQISKGGRLQGKKSKSFYSLKSVEKIRRGGERES